MSEEQARPEPPPAPEYSLVTVDDVVNTDFEAPIRDVRTADCRELSESFNKAAAEAQTKEAARLFGFLASVSGFHFKPGALAEPFEPMMVMGNRRSLIPSDFGGELAPVVVELFKKASHPALKARLADTAWLNDRRQRWAADAAIEAYLECINGLLERTLYPRFRKERAFPHEAVGLTHRALRIARTVGKRGSEIPEPIAAMAQRVLAAAKTSGDAEGWLRAAKVCFRFGLIEPATVAMEAESLAQAAEVKPDLGIKELWDFAADAFREGKRPDDERRCRIEAAEQMVRVGRAMGGFAASGWIMNAIDLYRTISGTRDRRTELEAELREHQKASLDQFGSVSHSIDMTDVVEATDSAIQDLSLAQTLALFAEINRSEPIEELRAEALQTSDKFPLSAMFASQQIDFEGKVVSKSPGSSLTDTPDETWIKQAIADRQSIHRRIVFVGKFEPFRRHFSTNYSLSDRHFRPITEQSPFVPPGYEHIFALGFSRLVQGDFVSAAHLLIPQMENSLRYVLKQTGQDPSMIQADLIQEDRSLSAILVEHRGQLDAIFGPPLIDEIDLLFNDRVGPALRHEFAHGKLTAGACQGSDAVYACWLLYRLTCLPLFEVWDAQVAPHLQP